MTNIDIASLNALGGEELLTALEKLAVSNKVSDIHINPNKNDVRVEWRQKGILLPLIVVKKETYITLQRRIKFQSKLKLNIETVAQDGQYTFAFEDRVVNVRVATIPTRYGEAFTLRFLDPQRGIVPLEKLGFPAEIEKKLLDLTKLPNGLILVTGPTGSGKTTTLYALLSLLTGKSRNIVTLEDPIEYELADIVQSQVDPEHGYTFASGLRAILRHDPDIILVGEIRDYETAQTAVDAALTGHLVLATLHTNSSIEAIPRLLSMGVSPYTFAPSLRAILAQRLVRTLTPDCQKSGSCDASDPKSYGGQCALPELFVADAAMRDLILSQAQEHELETKARENGFKTMSDWGKEFLAQNITTKEEIERVTA